MTPLTKIEFELLVYLSDNPRRVLSRGQIMSNVWSDFWSRSQYDDSDYHVLEAMVSRLRSKLGESARKPRYIKTIRGVGYRFDPQRVLVAPLLVSP